MASQAPALAARELEAAHKALALAEDAHDENVGGTLEKTLGYVAERRAEAAEAIAGATAADQQRKRAEAEVEAGINQVRERMAARQQHEEAERKAREEIARRADAAMEGLGAFATVKRDDRGTVVSVPGTSLFPDGQSKLSPAGLQHIGEIADAMRLQQDRPIVVQGHGDARGGGQALAKRRAEAVRDELVSRGIPADRIRAEAAAAPRTEGAKPTTKAEARSIDVVLENAH